MKIVQVCAVYRERPVYLVVQTEDGEFVDLSLKELEDGEIEFDDKAWKQLVEDYRIFSPSYR